jgi:hypothetical protein
MPISTSPVTTARTFSGTWSRAIWRNSWPIWTNAACGEASSLRRGATRPKARTIVFPHLGGTREDIFARVEIVAKHENTCIELSGSGVERVGILERAVKEIGPDRVLYGSDFTINEPSAVIARVRNAFLTPGDREKILFRNVERLLAKSITQKPNSERSKI